MGPDDYLEVMHTAYFKNMGLGLASNVGVWYFRTRGSGVWISSGKNTIEGDPSWAISQDELRARRAEGFQTLQFPTMYPNNRFEVVDLRHGDMEDVSCVGEYRTGFDAELPCVCEPRRGFSNCFGGRNRSQPQLSSHRCPGMP